MKIALAARLLGGFWVWIQPILRIYLTKWGRNLFEAAFAAVAEAERQSSSGDRRWTRDEKIEFVRQQLLTLQWTAGIPIADRVIETVIRLAVMRLQPEPEATKASKAKILSSAAPTFR